MKGQERLDDQAGRSRRWVIQSVGMAQRVAKMRAYTQGVLRDMKAQMRRESLEGSRLMTEEDSALAGWRREWMLEAETRDRNLDSRACSSHNFCKPGAPRRTSKD